MAMMRAKIFETHLAALCNKISWTIKTSQRHFVAFFQGLKDTSSINKVCVGIISLFTQKHFYCLIRQFQNSILHTE